MKKFALCFLLVISSLYAQAQPLILEVWVKRVPMDSVGVIECFKQTILAHIADDHFGMFSGTDTLALQLESKYTKPPIWQDLLTHDRYSILSVKDTEGHILLIFTPLPPRRKARYALMMSSQNICNNAERD